MPIGKNAIKRVSGTRAQEEKTVAPVTEVKEPVKKTAPKKAAPKKSMEVEPSLSPVKTAEKVIKKNAKAPEISRISLGEDLPYYLL